MSTIARLHSIERTSPKGPGQKFIGTCSLCGRSGLAIADMSEPCENVRGLTEAEALIEAIDGPASSTRRNGGRAVTARGDGSSVRRRKLTLRSLSMKREAAKGGGL